MGPFKFLAVSGTGRSAGTAIIGCMAMTTVKTDPALRRGAALFHGLSDRTRLAIVRRLADGEARVVDLIGDLGLAQSTVSAHVACLRDCGLVAGRPEGRQVFYSLTRPELMDLLGVGRDAAGRHRQRRRAVPQLRPAPAPTPDDPHAEEAHR